MMAIYILGGNFSARLMQTVRDKEGLTYGIGSSISSASYNAMDIGALGLLFYLN
ncbi:MAG: hypothetical protein Ct9H90mP20_5220 [Candidatus Neomarinimicrobiota bacterium]|nr:MAG: hypothetical protein Ct9H90mP20_5220 [Candidatus Neomarinimicrobiota bacterium]